MPLGGGKKKMKPPNSFDAPAHLGVAAEPPGACPAPGWPDNGKPRGVGAAKRGWRKPPNK